MVFCFLLSPIWFATLLKWRPPHFIFRRDVVWAVLVFLRLGRWGRHTTSSRSPTSVSSQVTPASQLKTWWIEHLFFLFLSRWGCWLLSVSFFPPFYQARASSHTPGPIGRYDYERGGCGNENFFSSSSFFLSFFLSWLLIYNRVKVVEGLSGRRHSL
jgi:hypothetical protein